MWLLTMSLLSLVGDSATASDDSPKQTPLITNVYATAYHCVYNSELAGIQTVTTAISNKTYTLRASFLSGGISSKNVKKAVKTVKPQWVDVSSSVEKLPGRKDAKKVREFIKAAKRG